MSILDDHETSLTIGDINKSARHLHVESRSWGVHATQDHRRFGIRDIDDQEATIAISDIDKGSVDLTMPRAPSMVNAVLNTEGRLGSEISITFKPPW